MLTEGVVFDAAGFETGIRTAMAVGTPQDAALRPVFVFADTVTNTAPADSENIPFNPAAVPVVVAGTRHSGVLCAVEYTDAAGQVVDLGMISPTRLKVTFLDTEYQMVVGFHYVEIAGDRYFYRRTEPPIGMVTSTIWTVHCAADDDR